MTWTDVPDSELLVDQAARSINMLQLRDNQLAVASGDLGAPRNQPASMWNVQNGTEYYSASQRSFSVNSFDWVVVADFYIVSAGTMTLRFRARNQGSLGEDLDIIATFRGSNTRWDNIFDGQTRSLVLSNVTPGEVVRFQGRTDGDPYIADVEFGVSGLPPIILSRAFY